MDIIFKFGTQKLVQVQIFSQIGETWFLTKISAFFAVGGGVSFFAMWVGGVSK
jgi:hypothetical protein